MFYGNMIDFPKTDASITAVHLRQRIQHIMRTLRAARPWPSAKFSEGGYFRIPIKVDGKPHNMPLGFVGSQGCNWARSGGCTMCDYGGFEGNIPDALLVRQATELISQWPSETEINLSSLGSFFDDKELSASARKGILNVVANTPSIKLLGVESRAADVTLEKIKQAKSILGSRFFEVGMGFESVNDFVRNVCINKGLSCKTFERAVEIIREAGAYPVGHVLFKAPFLTEEEAIDDAQATIEYLNALGMRRIVLMACNVKPGTLVGELHRLGLYRPPWLWSILRTALAVSKSARSKLLIYGFKCGLPMKSVGTNCPNCDIRILDKIENFNRTGESALLSDAIKTSCSCRNNWIQECGFKESNSLVERVNMQSQQVLQNLVSDKSYFGVT